MSKPQGGRRRIDPANVVIGAITALAVITARPVSLLPSHRPLPTPFTIAALFVLVVAAEISIVRVQYRGDVMALTLGEAVLAVFLILMTPWLVVLAAGVAQLVSSLVHRIGIRKTIFNTAQWLLGMSLAVLAFRAIAHGPDLNAHNVIALVAALSVFALVNAVSFVGIIVVVQRRPLRLVVPPLMPALGVGWALNLSFGVLFASAGVAWSPAVLLFTIPLAALHWASRGFAAAAADRARLSGMHRALQVLTSPIDPQEAIPRFLGVVRDCFSAEAAELVLVTQGARTAHVIVDDGPGAYDRRELDEGTLAARLLELEGPTSIDPSHPDIRVWTLLRSEGWRDCIAAPLRTDHGALGVLCVFNRSGHEGFEEGEVAVLGALAAETAAAIQKGFLLARIIDERRKLSEIIGSMSDGIVSLDASGTILNWNPAMETITGFTADEVIGRRILHGLLPRDPDGKSIAIETGVDPDVVLPADVQIVTSAGEARWLSCAYTRVNDEDGQPASLLVVARDVTKSKELDRLKEDFVATVSHELRTPLTPIKGWAQTMIDLGDRLGPMDREEAAKAILRQAEGLERLILNLLEVAKIERGVIDLRDTVLDVRSLVSRMVAQFRNENPERLFVLEAEHGLYRARGDEVWVERILSNLLSNAIKYSPASEPIEIRLTETPGEVRIAVTDRGPGIPMHEHERVFERFQRLGDHMTRSTGGTGLGLYIARQLAGALGGALTVSSEPGTGATFILTLRATGQLVAVASA